MIQADYPTRLTLLSISSMMGKLTKEECMALGKAFDTLILWGTINAEGLIASSPGADLKAHFERNSSEVLEFFLTGKGIS